MNSIWEKLIHNLREFEMETSKERGHFDLFALFLREDAEDKWDLLASSEWLRQGSKRGNLHYMFERLRGHLDADQLNIITRIVIVDENNSSLLNPPLPISVTHGSVSIEDCTFNGLTIRHAYFFSYNPEISA